MHFCAILATLSLIGVSIMAYSAGGQTFPAHACSTLVDRTISAREVAIRLLNEIETRGNKQGETIIPASTGQGREPTKNVTKKHGRIDRQLEDQLRRKEMFTSKHGGVPPHMDIMIQKLDREKQLRLVREELRKVEGVLERELAKAKDGFEVPFVTMLKNKKLELQGKESRLK